jgi:transcriptional regulator with XRE-family HTH domain
MPEPSPLAEFLRARRERTLPRDVGLPSNGRRRTPGLRREEVATLAGVSVDYLVRLEQGRDAHPSGEVLAALADAMRMTDDERLHLAKLGAISANGAMCPARTPLIHDVAPTVAAVLDRLQPTPAFVLGPVGDVLAWNDAWAAVVGPLGVLEGPRPNLGRYVFLDARAHDAFPAWRVVADEQVARLRRAMARWGDEPDVVALVAELRGAPEFERRWVAHPVGEKRRGTKQVAHPVAGDLDLSVEVLALTDDSEQVLVTWLAADEATATRLDALVAPPQLRVVGRG